MISKCVKYHYFLLHQQMMDLMDCFASTHSLSGWCLFGKHSLFIWMMFVFSNQFWSVSNLWKSPIEATKLYLQVRCVSKQGGFKDTLFAIVKGHSTDRAQINAGLYPTSSLNDFFPHFFVKVSIKIAPSFPCTPRKVCAGTKFYEHFFI